MSAEWETVILDALTRNELTRTPAPGGWIYKSYDGGMCFVPTPPLIPTEGVGDPLRIVDVDFTEVDQKKEKQHEDNH